MSNKLMNPIPARIHVLLARDAPVGLVIRRGPAKQVATLLWDLRDDTFRLGQWFKGRIYERQCDLSPDGKMFLYFAMNGRWQDETQGCWTAVSYAPYLKAISLYPQGSTNGGGGLWLSNKKFWIHGHSGHPPTRESTVVRWTKLCIPQLLPLTNVEGLYYNRLKRSGWSLVSNDPRKYTFEKPVQEGWMLRKFVISAANHPEGKAAHDDEHELVHRTSGKTICGKHWEWADTDGKRLLWATQGKLFATTPTKVDLGEVKELYDFNNMKFKPIAAPY